ncbi:hypothetical protein [Pantoea agglomerans]|uniref:ORC-CDC6 family AAA ATPase n=1 Tax=Enterobacter agglomerans TaxID=549 RepID=UPI001F2C4AF4|nr:hypothetical protein [Pantoea agglomerans]UJL36324.1 hypothetical protein JK642_14465 [Pantoea agglomerans]
MDTLQRQQINMAFNSILRADYITLQKISELDQLEGYFIDSFGILNNLLQRQDSFISGRRGTGKTTNLLRGYYECLKTITTSSKTQPILGDQKILPIYIDLSTCNDIFDSDNELSLLEIHFIRQIISSLKEQLSLMFEDSFLRMFKKQNSALDELDFIEKALIEGVTLSRTKKIESTQSTKKTSSHEFSGDVSATSLGGSAKAGGSTERNESSNTTTIKGLNAQDFLGKVNEIKVKAKIDAIYVFIDEYSDLSIESQKNFSALLKLFLGSKVGMFFKLGVITDRYNFGEKIIIGRDIFPIPLDFNEYSERFNGAVAAMNKMQIFVGNLLQTRIEKFCPTLPMQKVFKGDLNEILYRLTRETIGVSRTLGIILQNAFTQAQTTSLDPRIGLAEINYGISCARKTYQKQFMGGIKQKLIPGFYMDLWNKIINKAISEKNKFPNRAASHLMIDPTRKEYLNIFCENFLLHFISENISSKHGGSYNLYSLDYDICNEYNILYADKKDDYTRIRFIYDPVLSEFDAYFLNSKQKSFKCPLCNKIYDENEVIKYKTKRCFEDDTVLTEIIHQDSPLTEGNFAEVEIKILGLISQLPLDEAMTAREIADSVGCTVQKVAIWGNRVLEKSGKINIIKTIKPHKYYSNDTEDQ